MTTRSNPSIHDPGQSISRPLQCYAYCYHYGGVAPPYYFEYALSATGSTCGCVGDTCTRVPAPGSFILETLLGAPEPPKPTPPGPYPPVFEDTVTEMNSNPFIPPAGVWNDGYDATPATAPQEIMGIRDPAAIAAATGILEANIPSSLYEGDFDSALLQMTTTGEARAYRYGQRSPIVSCVFVF